MSEIKSKNTQWFNLAKGMSETVRANGPEIPRQCGRQRHRDNVPAEEPKEYVLQEINHYSFLDHLLTQLQERFSSDHQHVALGLSLVPSIMKDTPQTQWSDHLKQLAEHYSKDLPSPENLDMECYVGE